MSAIRIVATVRPKRHLSFVLVAALVVVAAFAGLLLGGTLRSEPPAPVTPAAPLSGAGVRLQVPDGWARGDAAKLAGFDGALWLQNREKGLRAAIALLPAGSPTLLPEAFAPWAANRETVRLRSGYEAWRYRYSSPDGSLAVLYAAPTTTGVATVACLGPTKTAACDALVSTLVVPDSRRLELGKRAGFFSALPLVLSDLETARTKGERALDAATNPTGQALAADGLARAHMKAATDLAALSSDGDRLPSATVSALTATGTAYSRLSRAALARIPQPYADAGRAVAGADADLRGVLKRAAAAANAASLTAPRG